MRKLSIAIAVALVFLSSGCVILKSNITGVPYWMYEPQSRSNAVSKAYAVSATAQTERQAQLLAYSEASETIGEDTGSVMSREHVREFTTLGSVKDMGLKTLDVQTMASEGGLWTCYLLVSVDREYLDSVTTPETIAKKTLAQDVENLILEGDAYMMDGNDISAVSCYLRSMALSFGVDYISEEYSFETMAEDVKAILSSLEIRLVSYDPDTGSCRIRALRRRGILRFSLSDCPIDARVGTYSRDGSQPSILLSYTTGNRGYLDFTLTTSMARRSGEVRLMFGIKDALEKVESVAGLDACKEIRDVLDAKTVSFSYQLAKKFGKAAVAGIAYYDGLFQDGSEIASYVAESMKAEGLEAVQVPTSGSEDDTVLLSEVSQSCPDADIIVIVKAGMRDVLYSKTGYATVFVEGGADVYSREDGVLLFSTGTMSSSGMETSLKAAFSSACDVLVRTTYETLRQRYV